MTVEKLPPIRSSLQPSNHPYLNGAWTPQHYDDQARKVEVMRLELVH